MAYKKEYLKEYYEKNKESLTNYKKEYYEKNKEKIRLKNKENYARNKEINRERSKEYYNNNKECLRNKQKDYYEKNKSEILKKQTTYTNNRKLKDPLFKLISNIRNTIYCSLKRNNHTKSSRTQEILGCSFEDLKNHLESKFEPWMTWDNHGKYNGEFNYGWDIDHIIPLSNSESIDDIIKLNHYTNLQPLCSKVNRDIKRDKIIN